MEHDKNTEPDRVERFKTARRTVFDADISSFVCLVGLWEPIFADMEFIKENMPESHHKRFAPAPLILSLGMGLVAPIMVGILERVMEGRKFGPVAGMAGLTAKMKFPVYPNDTLHVEGEAWVKKITTRGYTLVDVLHLVKNQDNVICSEFTETIMYLPPVA